MRDVCRLDDPSGPRLDIALDQLKKGMGFAFRDVWFRMDGTYLRCEAVDQSLRPLRDDARALALIDCAKVALGELKQVSSEFRALTKDSSVTYSVIHDYGMGTLLECELVEGTLVWQVPV